jgi:hypothetical protein
MTDEKIEPLTPCLECGHATPHDQTEYEDTHARCRDETKRILHPGPGCWHKRYSKRCEEAADADAWDSPNCYSLPQPCYCSSEDREIASLKAELSIERKAREKAEERVTRLAEALEHETWCRTCGEDGCANCNGCTSAAALTTDHEEGK